MSQIQQSVLRILSFGAGAIGTYVAGSLALHGHRVVFLERSEVAEELRQSGINIAIGNQNNFLSEITVADNLKQALSLGLFDVAIFALKAYDTANLLDSLIPYADKIPPILCLQNGVESESAIATALGIDKVIPGTVTSAIGKRGIGNVVLERSRGMGIAGGHPLSSRLVEAMNLAGLNARLYEDPSSMKWSKLLTNLVANATSAILNMTPAEVFGHNELFKLELDQLRECLSAMTMQNIRPVNLPGTPVRLLAFAALQMPEILSRPFLQRSVGRGRGAKMPSFHIDLHSGRGYSEVDHLNGAIVRAGRRLGIPTPVNQALTETLTELTLRKLRIADFAHQPQRLLAIVHEYRNVH